MPITQNQDSLSQYLPLGISIISLGISLITVWLNVLLPAKILLIKPNRIAISADPFSDRSGTYIITATLTFYNSGAKFGVLNDLLIILNEDTKKRAFRTYIEFPNKTTSLSSKEIGIPESKEFNSFQIKGKESIVKTISFRQIDSENPIILTENKYPFSFYIKTNKDSEFKKATECNVEFDKYDIIEINKRTITPKPDGRNYIEISERNKPVSESENDIKEFIKKNECN